MQEPIPTGAPPLAAPRFYLTGRQPLRPGVILLAVTVAFGLLACLVWGFSHAGDAHLGRGTDRSSGAEPGADSEDKDDPSQIDTIVLGDPADAPEPATAAARAKGKVRSVHPFVVVRLPRFGEQVGLIPNSPAGHLLYDWLAAFNRSNAVGLGDALPNVAADAATAAQLALRQETGGFNLISAKEVQPGVLVFRLRDQTPLGTEALGTLQMRPNSNPAAIASFSLRGIPSSRPASADLPR